MAFCHSYFDESGKFKDHRVISFCGVAATEEGIRGFNNAWNALLRKNELLCLHTARALQFHRNYSPTIRKSDAKERCENLMPFVDCILQNLDLGITISFAVTGYSKWSPGAKKRVGGSDDPAYLAFLQAMQALGKYALRDDDRITVMCDDDTETAANFYQLYRVVKKKDLALNKKLCTMSFADDSQYPALQAADLIAALVRLESLKSCGYHTHDYGLLTRYLLTPRADQKLKWVGYLGCEDEMMEMGKRVARINI